MADLNVVCLTGRLTRDVELRTTTNGKSVASTGIAVSGRGEDDVTFVEVTLWDKQAEFASKYFKKGSGATLRGRLSLDKWEKEGQKFSRLFVVADDLNFSGPPKKDNETEGEPKAEKAEKSEKKEKAPKHTVPKDDDVPF